jgi:hypothetical protein
MKFAVKYVDPTKSLNLAAARSLISDSPAKPYTLLQLLRLNSSFYF